MPISIVEALRAGLPVMATDCGGVRELVDETVGRLGRVDGESALASALVPLCRDDALRADLAAGAWARSQEDRLNADPVYRGYLALYEQAGMTR